VLARTMTSADLVAHLERAQVPYSPVNTPFDVLDDPHLTASGGLIEVQTAEGDAIKVPALPIASDSFQIDVRHDPPALGQHSREVLAELGYVGEAIERLIAGRVVRADGPTLNQPHRRDDDPPAGPNGTAVALSAPPAPASLAPTSATAESVPKEPV